MTSERQRRIEALYQELRGRPADEWGAALAAACPDDPGLRAAVVTLLERRRPDAGTGQRIGAFEVLGVLGAGGMGQVYRARDTRLEREVAIKLLPRAFRDDPDRRARFLREARILASLNHPHIGAMYGLEEADGVTALVMELVEGDDLLYRIEPGGLPVAEAMTIARQIAEALEAAHEQGVIHRDLKPANIKLRSDGTIKVLDFGLAKALAPAGDDATVTILPTETGLIMGTPAYMSPEQARGDTVDRQTDVWAFGVVLYELLTGLSPFRRQTSADTLASVLGTQPDLARLRSDTPLLIRRLIGRCLEKDRTRRLRHIGDARLDIDEALASSAADTGADLTGRPGGAFGRVPRHTRRAMAAGLVIVAAGLASGILLPGTRNTPPVPVSHHWSVLKLPAGAPLTGLNGLDPDIAISSDGTRLVILTGVPGTQQLVVHDLSQLEGRILEGLGQAPRAPVLSPDGSRVAFFEGNALKTVAATGGPVRTVARIDGDPRGASWGTGDTIVYATSNPTTGLFRVSLGDGQVEEILSTADAPDGLPEDYLWPQILPGSGDVLFTIVPPDRDAAGAQLAVFSTRTNAITRLVQGSHGRYVGTGHLIYGITGSLWAVAFDLARLRIESDPVRMQDGIVTKPRSGAASLAIAENGTLAYVSDRTSPALTRLLWVDRQGNEQPLDALPPGAYRSARLSADGTRVVVGVVDQDPDIGVLYLTSGTFDRLAAPGSQVSPLWTRDDRRIVYASDGNIWWRPSDGTGAAERLTRSGSEQIPESFSRDDAHLLFLEIPPGQNDVRALSMTDGSIRPLLDTPAFEREAAVSPDGHWLAYSSNESNEFEIYVRRYPGLTDRILISKGGGTRPIWSRTGDELFYMTPQGQMIAVRVRTGATSLDILSREELFVRSDALQRSRASVGADGRFLMLGPAGPAGDRPVQQEVEVREGWHEELTRLVPR